MGGDKPDNGKREEKTISIRTPAWGVTPRRQKPQQSNYFNSHPRVGGDSQSFDIDKKIRISIRTPAWGVTGMYSYGGSEELISIRTPAWGVTIPIVFMLMAFYFNSHPRVGGDSGFLFNLAGIIFQFAPPRGG